MMKPTVAVPRSGLLLAAVVCGAGALCGTGVARAGAPSVSTSPVTLAQALPAPDLPQHAAARRSVGIVTRISPGNPGDPATAGGDQPVTVRPIWSQRTVAILDVLDKEDGAVARLKLPVGTTVTRGKLRLKVGACVVRPRTMAPDAALYVTVRTLRTVTAGGSSTAATPVFSGWLIRSEPGATVVGDAAVTFRLIGCGGA